MRTISRQFTALAFLFLISSSLDAQTLRMSTYVNSSLLTPSLSMVPRWSIGVVRPLNDKWMIGMDVEYGNYNLLFNHQRDDTYLEEGYRSLLIQPQFYFVLRESKSITKYLSADVLLLKHNDHFDDETKQGNRFFLDSGEQIIYDQANYHRTKIGFNINYGVLLKISRRIGVDMSTGLGLRSRNVRYSEIVNPYSQGRGGDAAIQLGTNYYMQIRGVFTTVNFNADAKIYYRFGAVN